MSYEVIHGKLVGFSADDRHHAHDGSPVDEAVADAREVLEAAGWDVRVHVGNEDWNDHGPIRGSARERTVARSPWREVSDGE